MEAIIAYKLNLLDGKDRLFEGLRLIEKILNDSKQRDTCGWTDLQYHIAHKIRILHGRTHATTRVPLRPELALSTVEDLNCFLRESGFER